MLNLHLHQAGFFPISWAGTAAPGTMYVRPSAKGVLRAFVPAHGQELELFAGSLLAGELRYRGPVTSEAQLRQVLAGAYQSPMWPR